MDDYALQFAVATILWLGEPGLSGYTRRTLIKTSEAIGVKLEDVRRCSRKLGKNGRTNGKTCWVQAILEKSQSIFQPVTVETISIE